MSLDDKIIRGKPHGGLSVRWNKSLSNSTRTIQYDDNRILCIEVKSKETILLFLSVYLPYDCDMFYDDYCFYLSKLQCITNYFNTLYVFILGAFHADIQSASIFSAELIDFGDNNELCFFIRRGCCPTHLRILVKLMVLHHGWTTALLRCQVNLLFLMCQSLTM